MLHTTPRRRLEDELVHTDDRAFQRGLRESFDRLERIRQLLISAEANEGMYA